uniref:hypothetical protein RF1 n=1 Tax=Medicago rotata TaxID=70971 RepID=UPI00226CDD18|nr:hypothetical protein RF1 [Medicago rotata]UZC30531.1 hypothetical protein RF1 [Medicago rotata]
MSYQPFLVRRLVAFLKSAIVTGIYYGFLSSFSRAPSYLFLIRARVMDEGTETEVAATTGFITGQLMMFISIYYAPLHLALIRPHTITALSLPYLFFHFLSKNDKHYYFDSYYLDSGYKLDSGDKNPNSIAKFHIYKVFLNNLIFQLINPLLFPSSILLRVNNIYLFRSNNKILFLTGSFLGWLLGHICLMKGIGFILLLWEKKKNSIKSKLTMRFDKYILLQFRNYAGQIFVTFSFVMVVYYLGRRPFPYIYTDEIVELELQDKQMPEIDVQIDSETEETKQEQNDSSEDVNLVSYLFPKKDKTLDNIEEDNEEDNEQDSNILALLEKPLVTTLFDYRRWHRPFRYIKNDHLERGVRDENSQFFFQICKSDGKERISFTYPPDLSSFLKIMEKKMDIFTGDKICYNTNELSNSWSSTNKEKRKKLINELLERAKLFDRNRKFIPEDLLENRIRLSNDNRKRKYLPKRYDPFLNGPFRGQSFSPSIQKPNSTRNSILINKIHGLLLSSNSNSPEFEEFEQKRDPFFFRKLLLTEIGFYFNLISKFSEKSVSSFHFDGLYLFPEHDQVKIDSEEKKRKQKFLLEAIRTDRNNQTIFNRKNGSGIKEINKEVPRWSYILIDELEQVTERLIKDAQIRSAKAERIVVFDGSPNSLNFNLGPRNDNEAIPQEELNHEFYLLNFSREPDSDRDIIKGAMRPLRRKTAITKLSQATANVHSPLFLEMRDPFFFIFGDLFDDLSQYWKEMSRKPGTDNSEFLEFQKEIEHKYEEDAKDEAEIRLRKIEEDWESILYGLQIRSFVLLTQSFIRKYLLLPYLIISKNIIRILLLQDAEWIEDFRDWRREIHIKCTYQGIPVSHKELPKNWFHEGLQIRILHPFVLKAWHKSKVQSTEKKKEKYPENKNFCFLTGYGTLVESYLDEGFPRDPLSIFRPVLKQISKQLKKDLKKRFFLGLKILNERKEEYRTDFRTMLKKIENWNIKRILKIIFFRFKTIDELSESKKTSTMSQNNSKIEVIEVIEESPVRMESINCLNSSFREKRIKDLNVQTETIIKQIETMTEEQKEGIITSEINLNSNKYSLQILQRRFVRLIRKSYSFFKNFIEGVYVDILLCISSITRIHRQGFVDFLESTDKILNVKKSIKKKMEERIENQSLIPFMSIIEKSGNITNMNSQNSWDVSSLSQAYVFFKLSQIQVSNGYKFKLRSIFESPGRSFFLKKEIKDYFCRIQGTSNSKLRHKKRPDSLMKQWTNWLKLHYQYDLPENRWSRLVSQNWRNRINEHRVAQNKDLVEYDSYEQNPLILSKKQEQEGEADLLEMKKKIKKQYRYDLFAYQYLNFADKKKSYIYGYRSLEGNKEFLDIIGDISIQNYLEEYDILYMEYMEKKKNLDRKYFNWMGKRKKTSIPIPIPIRIPGFWFFGKLTKFYDAYKRNPWILPIKLLVLPLDGQGELKLETEEYVSPVDVDLKSRSYYPNGSDYKYRTDLRGERDFLLSKYFGFYLHCDISDAEIGMENVSLFCLLLRMNNFQNIVITSIKKLELDIEILVDSITKDFCYTECRDTEDLKDRLIFFIEPIRLSRKNQEQSIIAQTVRLPLNHKRRKNWGWTKICRLDQRGPVMKFPDLSDNPLFANNPAFSLDKFSPENTRQSRVDEDYPPLYNPVVRPKTRFADDPPEDDNYQPEDYKPAENTSQSRVDENDQPSFENEPYLTANEYNNTVFHGRPSDGGYSPLFGNRYNDDFDSLFKTKYNNAMFGNDDNSSFRDNAVVVPDEIRPDEIRQTPLPKPISDSALFVPEHILPSKCRRTFRRSDLLNKEKKDTVHRKTITDLNRAKNKLMNFKAFLWPNYRLEDLTCMNRYWFNTHNGSRFSILRLRMFPGWKD